jgi:hypothetical protein
MGKKKRFQEFTARKMGAKQKRRGVRAVWRSGIVTANKMFLIFSN